MVPPAPQSRFDGDLSAKTAQIPAPVPVSERKSFGAMDEAFLSRIYRTMLWFGTVATLVAAGVFKDAAGIGSFVAGLVLAALLLRTQELLVRAVLRPKAELGFDPRLALMVALPLKYGIVIAALAAFQYFGLMRPAALALGFFAAQVVIIAKVFGWAAMRRVAR